MKLKSAEKVHYDAGPNMTPLVDVVMVILIFLMLTGTFVGLTHYLKANMPVDPGGAKTASTDNKKPIVEPPKLVIQLTGGGDVDDKGNLEVIGNAVGNEFDNSEKLEAILTAKLAKLNETVKPNAPDEEQPQAIIQPLRQVKHSVIVAAFSAASKAGFKKIAMGRAH